MSRVFAAAMSGLFGAVLIVPSAAQSPAPVTFGLLAQAVAQQDYVIVEQRRFRDETGNIVSVREQLSVRANGSNAPSFDIKFIGVSGEPPQSSLSSQWRQTYQRYGRLFVEQGSFQVRDLAKVQQNYTLHQFGTATRAGRVAYRAVVFPQSLEKSIWLVDIDALTFVPLYTAEFDSELHLLSEVESESFAVGGPMQFPSAATTAGQLVAHPDFAAASTYLGDPSGLIEPSGSVATDYVLDRVQTRDDPLNGRQRLVLTYTDGIDQFMVVQEPNSSDVFASLSPGVKGNATPTGHTIGRYRDAAVTVLVFWDQGVCFHVAGRGSLERLDDVAKRVYLQAIATQ